MPSSPRYEPDYAKDINSVRSSWFKSAGRSVRISVYTGGRNHRPLCGAGIGGVRAALRTGRDACAGCTARATATRLARRICRHWRPGWLDCRVRGAGGGSVCGVPGISVRGSHRFLVAACRTARRCNAADRRWLVRGSAVDRDASAGSFACRRVVSQKLHCQVGRR